MSSDKARVKTPAPTLAPHPPQRMAIAEISLKVSGLVNDLLIAGPLSSFILGRTENFFMKRLSIQSFHDQSSLPETV